jgi:hypothetical protein
MPGSINCTHHKWKNYPMSWHGYTGHFCDLTVISKRLSLRTHFWHFIFGLRGSHNDINVLHRSPLFDRLSRDDALACHFTINGYGYEKGYHLGDDFFLRQHLWRESQIIKVRSIIILLLDKKLAGKTLINLLVSCKFVLLLFEIRLVARQKYPRQQHDCFCQPTQYDHHENVNTSVKPLRDPKRIYAFLETYPRPSITWSTSPISQWASVLTIWQHGWR